MPARPPRGKVWLVGAGPGDPGLITVRGLELLSRADVVLYDALAHPALLEACKKDVELRDVGKRPGERTESQATITSQLIELARAGKNVVRLKGGDPLLFARGAEEALALAEAGVSYGIVPAVSSPVGAAAYAGISLTHRDLSSSVTFITGSDREGVAWSPEAWRKLATATDTLCVLMGMKNIEAISRALVEGGRAPDTPSALIHWGARPEQRVEVGRLGDIAAIAREKGIKNPSIILVGEVVSLRERLRWYDQRPLFGKRVLVPRAPGQAAATARTLRDHGAIPIVVPAIEIVDTTDGAPVERAIATLPDYEWVLFTSQNGVEAFLRALARNGRDARAFGAAKVGVVGARTAEALLSCGIRADLVADEQTGEGLASALLSRGAPKSVLLLRAKVAREALPRLLRRAGAQVDEVAIYETRPASDTEALAGPVRDGGVDVVLFTSGSTVRSLTAALGPLSREALAKVTVASIGPATTAVAEELGVRVDVRSEESSLDGLLSALEQFFA
jgi:uroporphyrinogen III methyltransferase/synthase